MSSWGSFSYIFGPLVAVLGISLFILVLRWSHAKPAPLVAPPPKAAAENDYGLLVPISAPASRKAGQAELAKLEAHGIKATLSATTDGLRLFVWPHEVTTARRTLAND